jgi:membrane protease YdiL (CAAX protease family)
MLKSGEAARIIGPIILFCALFLPGYLYQNPEAASLTLQNPMLLIQSIAIELPQVALIIYVILTRGHETRRSAGIVPLRGMDIPKILAGLIGLFILTLPAALIGLGSGQPFFSPIDFDLSQVEVLLPLALFCLVSGYREELFFRSYLITELEPFGKKTAILIGSLLFSLGHAYQGIGAIAVTALIGVFLGWLFLKTRNAHIISLAHGLYNFLVLLAAALT